jgi:hypothetical protein
MSKVRRRVLVLAPLVVVSIGAGCSREDPQAALEAAVSELQDNLEAKRTSAVLDMMDTSFRAQGDLDKRWAERMMTGLFLQNPNVKVITLTRSSRVTGAASGASEVQVVLAGGQGLLPERVEPYAVRMEWRRDGGRWKLAQLQWQ